MHEVILASGEDRIPSVAARHASHYALDALEGDAAFLTRNCDCRTTAQPKKKKTSAQNILLDFEEDEEQEILAVEQVLGAVGNASSSHAFEEIEVEEGEISH